MVRPATEHKPQQQGPPSNAHHNKVLVVLVLQQTAPCTTEYVHQQTASTSGKHCPRKWRREKGKGTYLLYEATTTSGSESSSLPQQPALFSILVTPVSVESAAAIATAAAAAAVPAAVAAAGAGAAAAAGAAGAAGAALP